MCQIDVLDAYFMTNLTTEITSLYLFIWLIFVLLQCKAMHGKYTEMKYELN